MPDKKRVPWKFEQGLYDHRKGYLVDIEKHVKGKFEQEGGLPGTPGEGVPGSPYAFLTASGRPCTDANLTRCKREEILPQAFAGNVIHKYLSKHYFPQLLIKRMQEEEKHEARIALLIGSPSFRYANIKFVAILGTGISLINRKQIKKRTRCPDWIFRG